jgi:hypothetical protein
MRVLTLLVFVSIAHFTAPSASAQHETLVHVRFFGDAPGATLDAHGPFGPHAPPGWGSVCVMPCATALAPGKYRLRLGGTPGASSDVRPDLRLLRPVDVFVERLDLARKRRRQRIAGIALTTVGVLLVVPGAVATRCVSRRDALDATCNDQLADGLVPGSLTLALGGLFLGLSFGPSERVKLSTYPYGALR